MSLEALLLRAQNTIGTNWPLSVLPEGSTPLETSSLSIIITKRTNMANIVHLFNHIFFQGKKTWNRKFDLVLEIRVLCLTKESMRNFISGHDLYFDLRIIWCCNLFWNNSTSSHSPLSQLHVLYVILRFCFIFHNRPVLFNGLVC